MRQYALGMIKTIAAVFGLFLVVATHAAPPPNVVLIISDDAGYADFSLNGAKHFPTPHIDSIARDGVQFAEGYVSAWVCSPSRAGLITGRYQQRFGHHHNVPPKYSETNGLPVEVPTFADYLHALDYRTIALGKWHLGYAPHFHPLSRGFDDYYGFLQGARSYWPLKKGTKLNRLLRDREPIPENGEFDYMTEALGREAARYIDTHAAKPFFVYLSFNAVHTPSHAPEELIATTEESLPKRRRTLAAMTIALDNAVGTVLEAIERNNLTDNTIVVFINDNGGQTQMGAKNDPLRGRKGQPYEGGIRVPFVARWPARWPAGMVYEHPVSSLDLLPTVLRAAGVPEKEMPSNLAGQDLTPIVTAQIPPPAHEVLFWADKKSFAIRAGNLKLLRNSNNGEIELFNIKDDPNETTNLATAQPEDVARLQVLFDKWNASNTTPRW